MTRIAAYAARVLLFGYVLILLAPFNFLALYPSVDSTWEFALNWGAAHGLALGRDLVWTTGPLWYLTSPQDVGHNLALGLAFQWVEWGVLAAIFADLFFVCGFALSNVAVFAAFFGLSAPLYAAAAAPENRLVAGALVLLVVARWRGGRFRYLAALMLAGLVPLIKMTGGILIGGAILGYVIDDLWRRRRAAWPVVALAAVVPAAVGTVACLLTMPSLASILQYAKGSAEVGAGYSAGMSVVGDVGEVGGAVEMAILVGVLLYYSSKGNRALGTFFALFLPLPFFLIFKHSFVRQDVHVVNFFCFAGLAMGLISIAMKIDGSRTVTLLLVAAPYILAWSDYVRPHMGPAAFEMTKGTDGLDRLRQVLHPEKLREALRVSQQHDFPANRRLEPELRAIVGDAPVGEMSLVYSSAAIDGLNLRLFPVVQRYAAFTAYLDRLNAAWLDKEGPRFLIADWGSIDTRDPFAETPAMWREAFRWYDTRKLGVDHLLLERRAQPRFTALRSIRRFETRPSESIQLPETAAPVFFSISCGYRTMGTLRKLLLRIAPVRIKVDGQDWGRVPMEAMSSPGLGSDMPDDLDELAALFDASAAPKPSVKTVSFAGPGIDNYGPVCQVELLTPVN